MAKKMMLDVLTPERSVCCLEVDFVIARAKDGEIGILPNHAPLVVELDLAPFRYKVDGVERELCVNCGFMEVKDNRVAVITRCAELDTEIDLQRAVAARERAEKRLTIRTPDIDITRAELALRRALTRIRIAEHIRR